MGITGAVVRHGHHGHHRASWSWGASWGASWASLVQWGIMGKMEVCVWRGEGECLHPLRPVRVHACPHALYVCMHVPSCPLAPPRPYQALSNISAAASKEHNLRKALARMKEEWVPQEFHCIPFKETGTCVIGQIDELQMLMDDQVGVGGGQQGCAMCVQGVPICMQGGGRGKWTSIRQPEHTVYCPHSPRHPHPHTCCPHSTRHPPTHLLPPLTPSPTHTPAPTYPVTHTHACCPHSPRHPPTHLLPPLTPSPTRLLFPHYSS